jgi:replicative DNA helicase
MGLGADFFATVMATGDVATYLKIRPDSRLFLETERPTFDAFNAHVVKYGALPSLNAMQGYTAGTADIATAPHADGAAYLYDQIVDRYIKRTSTAIILEARSKMAEPESGSVRDGFSWLTQQLSKVSLVESGQDIIDLRTYSDPFWAGQKKKFIAKYEGGAGLQFGWPTMDLGSIGLEAGDVVSYVGRPGMGKTWMLLYSALHAWRVQGKRVAFVTLEMDPRLIIDRIVAMESKVAPGNIMNANLDSKRLELVKQVVSVDWKNADTPFYVIDGARLGTVHDYAALFKYVGIDALFIDGAYMIENDDKYLGIYQKVGENMKLIKNRLAVDLGIPVIGTYQFNRDASKAKKSANVGIEDIGYSDAIGQYSSVVIGLFEDDNVESMVGRTMSVLKHRHGSPTTFRVKWDLLRMDFSELSLADQLQQPIMYE